MYWSWQHVYTTQSCVQCRLQLWYNFYKKKIWNFWNNNILTTTAGNVNTGRLCTVLLSIDILPGLIVAGYRNIRVSCHILYIPHFNCDFSMHYMTNLNVWTKSKGSGCDFVCAKNMFLIADFGVVCICWRKFLSSVSCMTVIKKPTDNCTHFPQWSLHLHFAWWFLCLSLQASLTALSSIKVEYMMIVYKTTLDVKKCGCRQVVWYEPCLWKVRLHVLWLS